MSSKLYKSAGVEVRPWAYRPATGSPAHEASAQSGPGLREAEVQARIDAAQRQAYAAGEAAGRAAGDRYAREQLAPVLADLRAVIQELARTRQRFRQEAEMDTVELAIAIARRVLHREISTDPEAILGLVKSAADRLNAREIHRLRVAPANAEALAQHRDSLNLPLALEIVSDPALPPGGVLFETTRGEVDASVGTQLEEIHRGLADLVRRR